ncbi:MAG: YlbF family regulator [Bacillota bacterium]
MDVYKAANILAKSIKENDKYQKLEKLNKELLNDPDLSDDLKRFYSLQVNFNGKDKEKLKEIEKLKEKLIKFPKVKRYFKLETEVNNMMGKITNILKDSIDIKF